MDGVLIIDKPAGLTSHDVVARVRKIIGERRVGHTGTLDPFATGVLILLIGRATRLAQFLSGAEKEYQAVIRLGYATDTGDVTGRRVETGPHAKSQSTQSIRKENIDAAMASLRGEIKQTPPMYSAKKIAGRKLYEHARRGEEIERQPILVTIREFEVLTDNDQLLKTNSDGSADIHVRVVCSAGTYVRALAEDLGRKLGTGAHLAALRRTRAGRFGIQDSMTLDQVAACESPANILISPNNALSELPVLELQDQNDKRVMNGVDIAVDADRAHMWSSRQSIRLSIGDELLAVGVYDRDRGVVHPQVVIKPN